MEIKEYKAPQIKEVEVKAQGVLCISNPDAYTTEMKQGDDNWS